MAKALARNSATNASPTTGRSSRTVPRFYIQRIFDAGNATKGYKLRRPARVVQEGHAVLHDAANHAEGDRLEQTQRVNKPWYTKSGRLQFYRDEDEFIDYGENMPVHREPVDGTQYEPSVMMALHTR